MKPLKDNITGIYSLMLTPYFEDKSIDYNTYEAYAEWQAASGVDHLFAVCGTSEMSALSLEERLRLAALTVKHKGETTVVATANMCFGLEEQLEEVRRMSDTGVDGLVFTTKGLGDRPDALVEYIGKLCEATSLPVFLYEFPGLQPHLIDGDTYGRLVSLYGIKGIKDTTCSLEKIKDKIAKKGDSCVIQANMPYLYDAFVAGAGGVMATPTACGSAFFARFFNAFRDGDLALAKRRYHEITLLDNAIDSGFNNSAKYLVQLQGIAGMRPINRGGAPLSPARMRSIAAFHEWCVDNGLMR